MPASGSPDFLEANEEATRYLFDKLLRHTPLKQAASNHRDGLLSLKSSYLVWDNKSKEQPGLVSLKSHLPQFHAYMEASEKAVPVFVVIAPGFTEGRSSSPLFPTGRPALLRSLRTAQSTSSKVKRKWETQLSESASTPRNVVLTDSAMLEVTGVDSRIVIGFRSTRVQESGSVASCSVCGAVSRC